MSLVAFLLGTAVKSAVVAPIAGFLSPAAFGIAVVGGVVTVCQIFKAINYLRTEAKTDEVAVETVLKTYDIFDNFVDATPEKGSRNQANSGNNQNYHPNTQTQHTNNTRSDGTDCTGGPGGDDPRKPNHNPIPVGWF